MKVINLESIHRQNIHIYKKYSISVQILLFAITMSLLFCTTSTVGQELKEKTIVPIDLTINKPVIELYIHGKGPFRFILDTGAGANIIDIDVASDLGLEMTGQVKLGSPSSGNWVLADVVIIPEIKIFDIELYKVRMITESLKKWLPVDGIISINSFSEYLVTIDYPEEIIVFERGNLLENIKGVLPFNYDNQILSLQIEINGMQKEAHLDTGSPQSFAFPYSIKDKLNLKSNLTEIGYAHIGPDSFMVWSSQLEDELKLGSIVFEAPQILFEDRPGNHVNIGYSVIKDFSITIDLRNKLIDFKRKHPIDGNSFHKVDSGGENEFTGRYGGVRSITYENGDMFLQRDGGMKLKLLEIGNNLYQMELPDGMKPMNELPNIRFDRNKKNEIYRITFIHEDGKEESALKDN